MLRFTADSDKSHLAVYNLANSILWYEFFTIEFKDKFEESNDFLQQMTSEEPTLGTRFSLRKLSLAKSITSRRTG